MPKRWHVRIKTNGIMDGVVIAETKDEAIRKLTEKGINAIVMTVYLSERYVRLYEINEWKQTLPQKRYVE